ncbi:hypothetical protein BJV77DRAFT_377802 [Russula vinacea]|nr:hypothetical protein BJV77DRAFT_377802 [Russula vinacea]
MQILLSSSPVKLASISTPSHLLPPIPSTSDAQSSYTQELTQLFLDQAHANVIGGLIPNTNSPDSEFGKCMQCVAIDRARYQVKPPLERSSICTRCFQQYCFNPNNLTSGSELPRKLGFVNPVSQGVRKRRYIAGTRREQNQSQ